MRVWRVLFILWVGCLLPLATLAQQTVPFAGAEEAIMRADALGTQRNFDGAITLLKRALDKYPTYERLYLSLAYWQEARGVYIPGAFPPNYSLDERKFAFRSDLASYPALARDIFETYGLGLMNVQDARFIQRYADNMIYQEFPLALGQFGPLALPGNPTFFTYAITDPQLSVDRRGVQQCLITTQPWELTPFFDANGKPVKLGYTSDPRYGNDAALSDYPNFTGWVFNRMIVAYEMDAKTRQWVLRYRVMWQDAPARSAARRQLARSVAELLLRLGGLGRAYGEYTPRFAGKEATKDTVVNVWLAEKGQTGGEALDNNIYLFDVGTPRSDAEWVREVAHEFGHVTLPLVGGYALPEYGANGRLGERLYLRWLLDNPALKDETHPWLRGLNAAELKTGRLDAPIKYFANLGPESPKLRDTDPPAMEGYIGLALYLDAAYGSTLLADSLRNMNRPIYGDGADTGFLDMLERNLVMTQEPKIVAQPIILLRTAELPQNINYWTYLYDGKWSIELEFRDDNPPAVTVEIDGKACFPNAAGSYATPAVAKGWHRLRVSPVGVTMPALTSIKLIKQ